MCFADSREDARYESACREMCRSVSVEVLSPTARLFRAAWAGVQGKSMSEAFFYSRRFAQGVREALQRRTYDLVFVYCTSMGRFVPLSATVPIVADFVDADSAKWAQYARGCSLPRSWLYHREARAVAASELDLGSRAVIRLATTAHDATELRASHAGGDFPVQIMRNGVEIPETTGATDSISIVELKPFVVFVGTMSYRPNAEAVVLFARDIFPLVRRMYPEMNFVIVGRDPGRAVRRLESIPGVIVTGRVPDVFDYLRNAEMSVAPFRISQGFHNKIAESLAVGTPVVTSERAAAGIGLSVDQGLFTAETPDQFVKAIDYLMRHTGLRTKLRDAAATVRHLLGWQTQLERLEQQMLRMIGTEVGPVASTLCNEVLL